MIGNETIEMQICYFNYLIGIDILKNLFDKNLINDINLNYRFCDYLSRKYVKSEEYKNCNLSYEESLKQWIESREIYIKSLYFFFISTKLVNKDIEITDITESYNKFIKGNNEQDKIIYNGNLKILEVGENNNQKVVLIEKDNNGVKEYLVAYDYRIENNNLSWNKAYFYSTNEERAKLDFKNAIREKDVYNLFEIKQDIGAIN